MPHQTLPLDDDGIYHIYNRAVGNEQLFLNEQYYLHFLQGLEKYLLPHVHIWSYCLLPNHFHLLAEIRTHSTGKAFSKAISDCCNAHTKWLNTLNERKGNLFMRPFKRNKIKDDTHLAWTIWYIHRNPVHHNYIAGLKQWRFSSYNAIGSDKTKVDTEKVLEFFGGYDNFIKHHSIQLKGFYDSLE